MLKINRIHMAERLYRAHQRVQLRISENNLIKLAHNAREKVAIVWSGMDCDGVAYSNVVTLAVPNRKVIDEAIEHEYKWADGPCSFYLAMESDVKNLRPTSRDLGMEAFEDGHPHVLYN